MRVLVTLTAYDPALPGTRTFYLTNGPLGFATTPSETPASQRFDPTLLQPLDIARRVQGIGGAARPALGELRVANADGAYDAWLGYAWDGRAVEVRVGPDAGAYPSDYPVRFTGTIDRVDVQRDAIVVRVRDPLAPLDRPLLTDRFAGDNVPPDGLEGLADLADRIKPRIYGRVKDIPLTLVNPQKLIYHVSDKACEAIEDVRDSGISLAGTEWGGFTVNADLDYIRPFGGTYVETLGLHVVCGVATSASSSLGNNVGGIFTSSDFSTWTNRHVGGAAPSGFDDIAWSEPLGLLCVVGQGGVILTSPDGITWTPRTSGTADRLLAVHYDAGLFVVAGLNGTMVTSPDGITWTARTSGFAGNDILDVNYGAGHWVAVGEAGTITTSPDGVTWTARTSGAGSVILRNVEFSRDLPSVAKFVVVGTGGTIIVSTDALTWSPRVSPIGAADIALCALTPSGFYAFRILGGNGAFSLDGEVWTEFTHDGRTFSAYYAGARLFVLGQDAAGTQETRTGTQFTYAEYATAADLEDDDLAPGPGIVKWYPSASGTYVRLGFAPFGNVTADVTQGATAADRTPAALFEAVLTDAGYTSSDWVAGDFSALDTADNAECGVYVEDTETIAEVLDAIARTPGAWWGVDAAGDFRIQQLTAPSGTSTFTITEHDVVRLERVASSDPLLGLPSTSTTLRFAAGSTPLLDGTATDEDAAVLTTHLLAQRTEEETLYTSQSDALSEAARRQTLRGTMRSAFLATVPLQLADGTPSAFAAVDLGAVGTLDHPRFGLSGGVLVRVLGVQPDYANKLVTLTLWR